jgi:hypothetical protein
LTSFIAISVGKSAFAPARSGAEFYIIDEARGNSSISRNVQGSMSNVQGITKHQGPNGAGRAGLEIGYWSLLEH